MGKAVTGRRAHR